MNIQFFLHSDIIYTGNSSAELLLFLVLKQKKCEKHGKSQTAKKKFLHMMLETAVICTFFLPFLLRD